MSIYKRLDRPIVISNTQLEIIGQKYPYGSLDYRDILAETREFLKKEFSDLPDDTLLIAITNHNGMDRQWGILLLQLDQKWHVVAEFGHSPLWQRGLFEPRLLPMYGDPFTWMILLSGVLSRTVGWWLIRRKLIFPHLFCMLWGDHSNHSIQNPDSVEKIRLQETA